MTERIAPADIDRAAQVLRQGGTVAFPTETVFGLGASAWNEQAIRKVFEAKGRPSDNPLIVHLHSLQLLGQISREVPQVAYDLFERFSPGPITLVLKKSSSIPQMVTAGLDSVAVRIPNHPIALSLLESASIPVVAPSANRSGRPSGTTWQSVLEDLDGRIDAIVCGSGCAIGIESTVVDLTVTPAVVLRPGIIALEDLQNYLPAIRFFQNHDEVRTVNSPGLRYRHYQPRAPMVLIDGPTEIQRSTETDHPVAFIGLSLWSEPRNLDLSLQCKSIEEYANSLFEFLRIADRRGAETIYCERVEEKGIGRALMDRLRRASS